MFFTKEKKGDEWVDTDKQLGFGLRVTKTDKQNKENKDSLSIAFTWAEVELLRLFLKDGLNHIFDSWFSENINRLKKGKEAKPESPESTPNQEEDKKF